MYLSDSNFPPNSHRFFAIGVEINVIGSCLSILKQCKEEISHLKTVMEIDASVYIDSIDYELDDNAEEDNENSEGNCFI